MFYYPEVLQRHRGCLGTVWLAATCSSRLLRREYLGVDVPQACAAVSSFLIGRGGWEVPPPPPGAPPPRCSLRLAAQLGLGLARVYWDQCRCLLEEVRQVLERLHRARPPPSIDLSPPRRPQLLPGAQAQLLELELAPDPWFGLMGPELPSPTVLLAQVLPPLPPAVPPPGPPPLTVTPESITLREAEPKLLPPPIEEELPEVTARELQLLEEAEAELLPPEEVPEVPPVPAPRPPPEPSLVPELPPPRRRRPAPRLPHIDLRPQIPLEAFKTQLGLPHICCGELTLLEPPSKRHRTPAELFRTPTCGWLPPELWPLWDRCTRPGPPRPPAPPPELPSEVEVLRETLEPSLLPLLSAEVSLETPEEEPRPRLLPPEERRLLPPPAPPALPELPEGPEPELPPGAPPDLEAWSRELLEASQRPGGAELEPLVPPGTPRGLVGRIFCLCLDLCAQGRLRLVQPVPYGPILLLAPPSPP